MDRQKLVCLAERWHDDHDVVKFEGISEPRKWKPKEQALKSLYIQAYSTKGTKKKDSSLLCTYEMALGFQAIVYFFFFFFKKKYAKSPSGSFPLVAEAAATSHIDPLSYCHGASLTISARVGYKSLCTQTRNHTFFIGWLLWHLKFPWVETCK